MTRDEVILQESAHVQRRMAVTNQYWPRRRRLFLFIGAEMSAPFRAIPGSAYATVWTPRVPFEMSACATILRARA